MSVSESSVWNRVKGCTEMERYARKSIFELPEYHTVSSGTNINVCRQIVIDTDVSPGCPVVELSLIDGRER